MYIVICLQIVYFFRNPLKQGTADQVGRGEGDVPNFYEVQHWIDYFKVSLVVEQNCALVFWVLYEDEVFREEEGVSEESSWPN